MAYSTFNPPILKTQNIAGVRHWWYLSEDSFATVSAPGYFTDFEARGLETFDEIDVWTFTALTGALQVVKATVRITAGVCALSAATSGGGGVALPATEIGYGNGTGITSDANLTYASRTLTLNANSNTQGFKVTGNANYSILINRSGWVITNASDATKTQTFNFNQPAGTGDFSVTFPSGAYTIGKKADIDTLNSDVSTLSASLYNKIDKVTPFDSSNGVDLFNFYDTDLNKSALRLDNQGLLILEKQFDELAAGRNTIYNNASRQGALCFNNDSGVTYPLIYTQENMVQVIVNYYDVALNDYFLKVDCDTAGSDIYILLPDAYIFAGELTVIRVDANADFTVYVLGGAATINWASSRTLTYQGHCEKYRSDGGEYFVIGTGA